MVESDWFMLTIWLALMVLGYAFTKKTVVIIDSIYGLYLGLKFDSIDPLLGLSFIVLNIYTALTNIKD